MNSTAGETAHAIAYDGGSSYWKTFPVAKMFMHPVGGSEVEIGYCYSIATAAPVVATPAALLGTTATLIAPNTVQATSFQAMDLYGVRTAPHGLSYMRTGDITQGITAGGTFGVRFYKDMTLSGVSASITIGQTSVAVQGAKGVTIGYINMPNGPSNALNAAAYVTALYGWGWDVDFVWGNYSSGAVRIRDGSSMHIEKSLVIYNGGYSSVDVRRNSSLIVGSTRALAGNPSLSNSVYDIVEGVPMVGNLSITGFGGKALRVSENSTATVGAMFVKHPLQNDPSVGVNVNKSATPLVLVDKVSSASFGRIYAVTHPGGKLLEDPTGAGVGLWTTLSGDKWGSHYQATDFESMLRADSASSIYLSNAGSMFAFDGGTANMYIPSTVATEKRQYAVFGSHQRSTIVTDGSEAVSQNNLNTPTPTRTVTDTRAVGLQKIMTRSAPTANNQYLYGATANRTWLGTGAAGIEHNYIANPTNIGLLGVSPSAAGNIGITYSAILSKGGSITN
jgi:hypothetical protein